MTQSAVHAQPLGSGQAMYELARRLYPICRSITGNGVRQTLEIIAESIPLVVHEVPSGTAVFDWQVPREWNIREAWIRNSRGETVVDFRDSNLHVVSYSVPVRAKLSLSELRPRLHSLPDRPDWIPYRTSYYSDDWGFCLTHRQLSSLPDDVYEVFIDSSLAPGHLSYGECVLAGRSQDEVLVSCHVCHPSLANDNLAGIAVATALAERLAAKEREYTYRFLFLPVTIGSITWLSLNEDKVGRIRHGVVITCAGDAGPVTYKKSRRGCADVDRAFTHVLSHSGAQFRIEEFVPFGYDERQYCSPAFDLPLGCVMRTPNGRYAEYHTSADNLDFIHPEDIADTLAVCVAALDIIERDGRYLNLNPKGEPQLGRRGLYRAMAEEGPEQQQLQLALLWVLNQSDGGSRLLDIAERASMPFSLIRSAADLLCAHGLLESC